MDFTLILKKLDMLEYEDVLHFIEDVKTVFDNSKSYNSVSRLSICHKADRLSTCHKADRLSTVWNAFRKCLKYWYWSVKSHNCHDLRFRSKVDSLVFVMSKVSYTFLFFQNSSEIGQAGVNLARVFDMLLKENLPEIYTTFNKEEETS